MPELPEVETTRRGIEPWLLGRQITAVTVRAEKLRWPVQPDLAERLLGQQCHAVDRRGKYLLLHCTNGCLLLHLGMSGYLRILQTPTPAGRHDRLDVEFSGGICLRLTDPRKFSTLLWTDQDPLRHALLADHGLEPADETFTGDYLLQRARKRTLAVKLLLMDHRIVTGIGNIYANEALFRARIHPATPAGTLTRAQYDTLVSHVRQVLEEAIAAGGTTLHDFSAPSGQPGYFSFQLNVYGQAGKPCTQCGTPIAVTRLGGRSTFFCSICQQEHSYNGTDPEQASPPA
jgi:formamidopyrimidine-DNA glycosylase